MEIDTAFRGSGRAARRRKLRRRVLRWGLCAALLGAIGLGLWLRPNEAADDFAMVPVDNAAPEPARQSTPRPTPNFRTDPMILRLDQAGDAPKLRTLPGPETASLPEARFGAHGPGRLSFFDVDLLAADQALHLVLPSSSEDFAFFQEQRGDAIEALLKGEAARPNAPVEAGREVVIEEGDSEGLGALIAGTSDRASQDGRTRYIETRIANTTSTAVAIREERRQPLFREDIIFLTYERKVQEVLSSRGLDEDTVKTMVEAAQAEFGLGETLPAGAVFAMRFQSDQTGIEHAQQLSIYDPKSPNGYVGTLTRTGIGTYSSGADPWFSENLLNRAGRVQQQIGEQKDVRLIDAVFSTGLSHGLSNSLVGAIIVALSKTYDLDRFASPGDRLKILYAPNPGPDGTGLGQVLFVGLSGPSGDKACYIEPLSSGEGFGCASAGGGTVGSASGLTIPVKGVLTSGFGPRLHPILKEVRNHQGVDWGAPIGTPVVAALAGTVRVITRGPGYGKVIYLDHPGGLQTRYAHLHNYAQGLTVGQSVGAGELIGYVGNTGRSTGPHLHFELRVGGTAVDPLTWRGPTTVVAVSDGGQRGSAAVEALVDQIIKVESAGNARAKNPLSSATGLGQFINSTWLRMMRDYRPDLHRTMSRADLLKLRFDPALSREMVRNLARENEAFLRARGRPIRAGTLYLAHFLGPAGAAKALGADPNASVQAVMGAAVVNANPFLRRMTVADMIAWSDRKMRGKGRGRVQVTNTPPAVAPISPQSRAFRKAVDEILKTLVS